MNRSQKQKSQSKLNVKQNDRLLQSTYYQRPADTLDVLRTPLRLHGIHIGHDQTSTSLNRKKIFTARTLICDHIEIGAQPGNLTFQDLDKSFIPECFGGSKCGCQDSTSPCKYLIEITSREASSEMRRKYHELKSIVVRSQHDYTSKLQKFMAVIPKSFPQALMPSLQSAIKLEDELTLPSFQALVSAFWHSKVDYLGYFIYKQLRKCFQSQKRSSWQKDFNNCIRTFSRSLTSTLIRQRLRPFQILEWFHEGYGALAIPIELYSLFVHHLNKRGKKYLSRVPFVALLYLHSRLRHSDSIRETIKAEECFPWKRILDAALDLRLY